MAALRLTDLTKHFPGGVRAVEGLCLEGGDGELLVLMGPSGCGKTTTLRLVAGLETPTTGSIVLNDRALDGVPPKDRDVAMVFQHHALYPHLTVAGNLRFGLKLRGVDRGEIERQVVWAAEMLGIADLLARRPGELSGGQQQRVALGRAIVRRPGLFLLDEPLSSLDPALRGELRAEIRRLQDELRTTTVYVTHDQAEALTLGHRIAVMHDGRLQQLADPLTIYDRPANRVVAAMFGSPGMNFLDGGLDWVDGEPVFLVGKHLEGTHADAEIILKLAPLVPTQQERLQPFAGKPVTLGVRPEHVRPVAEISAEAVQLSAEVESIERPGAAALVHLRLGAEKLTMRTERGASSIKGDRIALAIAAADVHFFDSQSEPGRRLL